MIVGLDADEVGVGVAVLLLGGVPELPGLGEEEVGEGEEDVGIEEEVEIGVVSELESGEELLTEGSGSIGGI